MSDPANDNELLVLGHLGMGDHFVTAPIIWSLACSHKRVTVLCKRHNYATVEFFFRDGHNIDVFGIDDDADAKAAFEFAAQSGFDTLGLGIWSSLPFDPAHWDQSFYAQAGLPFETRWRDYKYTRQPQTELPVPNSEFCLIHEDKARGYLIDRSRLPDLPILEVTPQNSANLMDNLARIEAATELHLMESCVAILADSLSTLRSRRRCIHHYTRQSVAPVYRLEWDHLR